MRERFGEPAWSNPSVRFVEAKDESTHARVAGDYSAPGLIDALVATLEARGEEAPAWLTLHGSPQARVEQALFGMHCFWVGERRLGALEGVRATRTGWFGATEVVEVTFDPGTLPFAKLAAEAARLQCATKIVCRTDAQMAAIRDTPLGEKARHSQDAIRATPGDDKHTLRRTPYRFVPLTPTQATKINALNAQGPEAAALLSPRQRRILQLVEAHPKAAWPEAVGVKLATAVAAAEKVAATLARPAPAGSGD